MTTLFGNICLALAIPVAGALIRTVLNYKPPHGGADGYSAIKNPESPDAGNSG
jgi:hypothetical protein